MIADDLIQRIEQVLPGVKASIDKPADPTGQWFVDFRYDDSLVTVDWKPPAPDFGISGGTCEGGDQCFGGPDYVVQTVEEATKKIVALLTEAA